MNEYKRMKKMFDNYEKTVLIAKTKVIAERTWSLEEGENFVAETNYHGMSNKELNQMYVECEIVWAIFDSAIKLFRSGWTLFELNAKEGKNSERSKINENAWAFYKESK